MGFGRWHWKQERSVAGILLVHTGIYRPFIASNIKWNFPPGQCQRARHYRENYLKAERRGRYRHLCPVPETIIKKITNPTIPPVRKAIITMYRSDMDRAMEARWRCKDRCFVRAEYLPPLWLYRIVMHAQNIWSYLRSGTTYLSVFICPADDISHKNFPDAISRWYIL